MILSFGLIYVFVRRSQNKDSVLSVQAISKDIKQSPPPHSPIIVKKSAQRARVFSGSKSKSRSRSNNRNKKNNMPYACLDNEFDKGRTSLNSTDANICCSSGAINSLNHNGVVMDLEDCCQMTLCDTVRYNFWQNPN